MNDGVLAAAALGAACVNAVPGGGVAAIENAVAAMPHLQEAGVDARDDTGKTALIVAAEGNDADTGARLVAAGAVVDAPGPTGLTPLH